MFFLSNNQSATVAISVIFQMNYSSVLLTIDWNTIISDASNNVNQIFNTLYENVRYLCFLLHFIQSRLIKAGDFLLYYHVYSDSLFSKQLQEKSQHIKLKKGSLNFLVIKMALDL